MSNVGIFLRCPVSVAKRIRAAIRRENVERAAAKLDPFALYKGEPCLPPYFARAGEREAARIAKGSIRLDAVDSAGREASLNVNFDIGKELAERAARAIAIANRVAAERGIGLICIRAHRPSLPQFFLRAGLLELERAEDEPQDEPQGFALAQTTLGRPIKLYDRGTAGHAICERVRELLQARPRRPSSLAKVCPEFSRLQVNEALSAMRAGMVIEERDGLVRLTEAT